MTSVTSDMLMSRANGDRARGNKGVWSMFFPDAQEEFARAWTAKSVASVALGRGFVVNYDDGTATWSDVSPLLESKLRQQGVQTGSFGGKASVRIRYLVLGDEGNFYVKFDNGRMEWCGQDSFGAALRRGVSERHLLVEKVAFAQEGGWLIIWSDRTFEAENIPDTLEQRLGGTRVDDGRITGPASGIKDITLGPAGEWFVIYRDHSVQADNLPDGLYKCLSQIREKTGRVRSIAFGENRSWFVRYWDGAK
ncbi:hypothetical protein GNI_113160 [Gregarina niphandrodes]|uniref:Uncharacterized protein n=1 Tax=Gregarina niphandrodes TaxID=110365 RepID=A0A023B3C8_GRENI|nr:hypothetical protein GNI_113160 [Gregarina niphandrodes]EZG55417.1 hypothetical protein GNI_113160 [Gregarina niphandrodes]|eukprot:XP_011131557.1 hypothetical protein GNI_113160 [Gregarina niphandrodes]